MASERIVSGFLAAIIEEFSGLLYNYCRRKHLGTLYLHYYELRVNYLDNLIGRTQLQNSINFCVYQLIPCPPCHDLPSRSASAPHTITQVLT